MRETVQWRTLSAQRAIAEAEAKARAEKLAGLAPKNQVTVLPAMPAPNQPVHIPLDEFQQQVT